METLEVGLSWEESLARIRTLADIAEGLSLVFVFGPDRLARQGLKQVGAAISGKRRVLWHRLDRHGAGLSDTLATADGGSIRREPELRGVRVGSGSGGSRSQPEGRGGAEPGITA